MKDASKNLLIILLVFAVLSMTYRCYKSEKKYKDMREASIKGKGLKTSTIMVEAKKIADLVDEKGMKAAVYEEVKETLPSAVAAVKEGNDSLKRRLDDQQILIGVKDKQITAYTSVLSTISAKNLPAKKQDTVFVYTDKNLLLRFRPKDSLTSGLFDFQYNAEINVLQYSKRSWFLARKKNFIALSSPDSRITINRLTRFVVQQKEPSYGLRLQGNFNYNPQSGAYGFGPAARFDLGRFSLQGTYLYYPHTQNWRPAISANIDLIRF